MAYAASDRDDFVTINIADTKFDAKTGNDHVLINRTGALVFGNLGDDWLSANIHLIAYDETVITTDLRGGLGDDQIYVSLSIANYDIGYDTAISANIEGGAGDDRIVVDLASSDAPLSALINGGSGDDTISVTFGYIEGGMGTLSEDLRIFGGAGNDTITVDLYLSNSGFPELVIPIHGGAGDDTITSSLRASGNDGGDATARIFGGAGDDVIRSVVEGAPTGIGGTETNFARGGAGEDRIEVITRGENAFETMANDARGGAGDDVLVARATIAAYGDMSQATNTLFGDGGDDHLTARIDLGSVYGTSGINRLSGGAGDDVLLATIVKGDGWEEDVVARSELKGGDGNDRLTVRGGDGNILWGNLGDDTLIGGSGADRLIGGQGADYLRGNGGADTFVFMSARGAGLDERDQIADFRIGVDAIDVAAIDADAGRPGNQSFVFATEAGAGHLWLEDAADGDSSLLFADTGAGLLVVSLLDGAGVRAADYSAGDFIL